jgi:hypothetical protein
MHEVENRHGRAKARKAKHGDRAAQTDKRAQRERATHLEEIQHSE